MKFNSHRVVLACTGIVIILLVGLSLRVTHPLSKASAKLPAQAKADSSGQNALAPAVTPPGVNAAAFKGQGRLAFVCNGLLYVLDGDTGEVKQVTDDGMASQPAWSHDGEWLAFRRAADPQAVPGSLWLARRDGTQAHQVQAATPSDRFSWSPTDDVLAVGGQNGIWLVPAGGETHQLLDVAANTLAWSPDGKSLAYSATLPFDKNHPEGRSDALYTIDIIGGQPVERLVAPQNGIILAGWWPDGKGLLYWVDPLHSASLAADGLGLYSLRLDSAGPELLARGLDSQGWLSLSPQGSLLMVTGGGRIVWADKSLAVINLESGDVKKPKNPAGCVAIDPSLSADGRRIAFVAARDLGDRVWGFDNPEDLAGWVASRILWIENADGSGAHPLKPAVQGVYQPLWSKDGSHILFVKDNSLWLINADGGEPEKICGMFTGEPEGAFGYYGFISYQDQFAWFQPKYQT